MRQSSSHSVTHAEVPYADLSLDQLELVVGTGPVGLRAVALGVTPIVAMDLHSRD